MTKDKRCWKCDEPLHVSEHFQSVRIYCHTCVLARFEVYDNRTEEVGHV
jgi:hypothetical protein